MVEVKFWNSFNECICFGFKTSIDFDDMESAREYVEIATVKNATEVTIIEYNGYEVVNEESYEILR